jgi:protein tyrosine phosphatase
LYENEDVEDVSVKDVLLELRKGRMGLIQTHDQLSFSYEAIVEGIDRMERGVRELRLKQHSFIFIKFITLHRRSMNWIV